MKNLFSLLVLGIICLIPLESFSLCEGCPSFTPWQSATKLTNIGKCQIEIEYKYRSCPDGSSTFYEMRIENITLLNSGDCTGLSNNILMETAIREVLNNAYSDFGISGTDLDVTMWTECCWEKSTSELSPCGSSSCCCETEYSLKEYTSTNGSKYIKVETVNQVSGGTGASCSSPCVKICDAHTQIGEGDFLVPQYTWCDESCSEEWSTLSSNEFEKIISTACTLRVEYTWRECNGDIEAQITEIKIIENPPLGGGCGNDDDVMLEAIEGLLAQIATLPGVTLPEDVKLKKPTCWDRIAGSGYEVLAWCDQENCCIVEYTLESDGSGGSQIDNGSTSASLLFPVIDYCDLNPTCTYVCETDYYGVTEETTLTRQIPIEIDTDLFENKVNVHPNPAENKVSIDFSSEAKGNVELSIYDNTGSKISSYQFNKSGNSINMEINLEEFNSGLYHFVIKMGSINMETGKFIRK